MSFNFFDNELINKKLGAGVIFLKKLFNSVKAQKIIQILNFGFENHLDDFCKFKYNILYIKVLFDNFFAYFELIFIFRSKGTSIANIHL